MGWMKDSLVVFDGRVTPETWTSRCLPSPTKPHGSSIKSSPASKAIDFPEAVVEER